MFAGLEPSLNCKHSSVMWAVGHISPTPIYCHAFLVVRPIPSYTAWWQHW